MTPERKLALATWLESESKKGLAKAGLAVLAVFLSGLSTLLGDTLEVRIRLAGSVLLTVLLVWVIARRCARVFLGKQTATKPQKDNPEHPSLLEESVLRVLNRAHPRQMSVRDIGMILNLSANDTHSSLVALQKKRMISEPETLAQMVNPSDPFQDHRLSISYRIERAGRDWLIDRK